MTAKDLLLRASVVGLGKLGSPLAALLASKGFDVIGVDRDADRVDALRAGRAPVDEPDLQERIDAGAGRLTATLDAAEAVRSSDVSFVIVPTPSGPDGLFTNRFVLSAVEEIGRALRGRTEPYVVVVTSTVMPGSTGGVIRAALEASSGRRVGSDLGLCYNPEFIALGSVIRDLLRPDFILIGESDERSGELLERLYRRVCDNDPSVHRMNFVNAEIAKLAVNTYVTTKISYANMLAELCDHLPGADVSVVTAALAADARIGGRYLQGSLAYGGPCFPRDNKAFAALARQLGARGDLAESTDRINAHQTQRLVGAVEARLPPGGRVGLLGVAYKPGTPVVEASAGLALATALASEGHDVTIYDPAAGETARNALGGKVSQAASAEECARSADVLVVTTAWPEFAELPREVLAGRERRAVVIDPWRLLPAERYAEVAELVHLGRGPAAS